MRPPRLNEQTLDLLYDTSIENLPEHDRWLDVHPDEADDRYVVIGEEVVYKDVVRGFGGCWPELADALESYDWNAGAPVFVVDLFSAPEQALIEVKLTPSAAGRRSLSDTHGAVL